MFSKTSLSIYHHFLCVILFFQHLITIFRVAILLIAPACQKRRFIATCDILKQCIRRLICSSLKGAPLPTDQRNLPRSLADHLPVATPLSRKAIWADSEGFVSGGRRNPSAAPPQTLRRELEEFSVRQFFSNFGVPYNNTDMESFFQPEERRTLPVFL